MTTSLTPEQAAYFDACMCKWQERLNLKNWRIEKDKKAAKSTNMAEMSITLVDRLATYRVGKFNDTSDREIDSTALHECLHVLLTPYKYACSKELGDDAVMAEEHAIIVFLEKLLMKEAT